MTGGPEEIGRNLIDLVGEVLIDGKIELLGSERVFVETMGRRRRRHTEEMVAYTH